MWKKDLKVLVGFDFMIYRIVVNVLIFIFI